MSVETADRNMAHLYPPFRRKLEVVLLETAGALGEEWVIAEGFRSQARQTWLFASGRTRPGPIVTWKRSATWHGTGLAADCVPRGRGYQAPREWWATFRHVYTAHGLENPAWSKGDLGHCQLTDAALRRAALLWVALGFRGTV